MAHGLSISRLIRPAVHSVFLLAALFSGNLSLAQDAAIFDPIAVSAELDRLSEQLSSELVEAEFLTSARASVLRLDPVSGFEMCECGRGLPVLKQVVGRRLDVLETPKGRKVPGEFFPHLMKEFPNVRRFQVVQRSPEQITVKLVVDAPFHEADELLLWNEIDRYFGEDLIVELQFVDDIPLTQAGKLRVVVKSC